MKIKYAVVALCVLFVVIIATITIKVIAECEGIDVISLSDEGYRTKSLPPFFEGVLSTGMPYVFRGEFDFTEYRKANGFHWERTIDGSLIANSPTEAAELGQILMTSWRRPIIVRYCLQTDNWVIHSTFFVDETNRILLGGLVIEVRHIFAINRSTGSVVEYFDNGWSSLFDLGHTSQFLTEDAIIQTGWQRTLGNDMLHHPSKGVLSTGLPYVFFGEFDSSKYREMNYFFWERAVGDSVIANSPTEAAELGQFYLSPDLRDNPIWRNNLIEPAVENITVLYCPQTDNWVVQWNFTIDHQMRIMRTRGGSPIHVFAINRTTGNVVEYYDIKRSPFSSDVYLRQDGWRRTLGNPERLGQRIVDRIASYLCFYWD